MTTCILIQDSSSGTEFDAYFDTPRMPFSIYNADLPFDWYKDQYIYHGSNAPFMLTQEMCLTVQNTARLYSPVRSSI